MPRSSQARPPNIVFILTDQQRFDSLGCTGAAHARTPHLDRLAAEGVSFDKHFVVNPVCSPSRGCIFSGQRPSQNGLWANGCRLPHDTVTMPTLLGRAGYRTAHFGKLHLEPIVKRTQPAHAYGFETYQIGEGDQHLLHDDYNMWLREQDPKLFAEYWVQHFTEGHGKAYTALLPESHTLTNWTTDRATEWLAEPERGDEPFFLSVGYFAPHHPFNPPEPYASAFAETKIPLPHVDDSELASKPPYYRAFRESVRDVTDDPDQVGSLQRAYHALMAQVDTQVGRILATLDEQGLAENTLVVFSSDHGEFLGERGLLWKGPYLLDDLMHVPLIARWPGRLAAGTNYDGLTSALDFFGTLGRVAEVETAALAPESRALFDAEGTIMPDGVRDAVPMEWEHPVAKGNDSLRGVRTATEKYVAYAHDEDSGELYNLLEDPGERRNLWAADEDAVPMDLRDRVAALSPGQRPDQPHEGGW
jgi:arylsulfatase